MPDPQGQLTIQTDGTADDLFELREWLSNEDELRGRVSVPPIAIRPGEMGGLSDALMVAVGTGGMGTVLVQSLSSWLTARRSSIAVQLTRPDGTQLSVDARRIKTPEGIAAVKELIEQLSPR